MIESSAEHEFEAAHGLPEALPAGEHILWQGSPNTRALAERGFHMKTLSIYFGVILLLRAATVVAQGGSVLDAVIAATWLLPAAVGALAMIGLMAWFASRTAVYTITDRRVVMRVGIVLTVTFNLPFSRIAAADANLRHGSVGDIALTLDGDDQIAYVHLWPHARPWRLRRTEPMLRCIDDAARVSAILAKAWSAARGIELSRNPPSTARPSAAGHAPGRADAGATLATH